MRPSAACFKDDEGLENRDGRIRRRPRRALVVQILRLVPGLEGRLATHSGHSLPLAAMLAHGPKLPFFSIRRRAVFYCARANSDQIFLDIPGPQPWISHKPVADLSRHCEF